MNKRAEKLADRLYRELGRQTKAGVPPIAQHFIITRAQARMMNKEAGFDLEPPVRGAGGMLWGVTYYVLPEEEEGK